MQIIKSELAKQLETYLEVSFTPTRATEGSNAYDVRACIRNSIAIHPGECVRIPLGFSLHIGSGFPAVEEPDNEGINIKFAGLLLPRSGLGSDLGVVLGNAVGLIDEDYQNQWICAVLNRNFEGIINITPGIKIAQFLLIPTLSCSFNEVKEFTTNTSRNGGFGSTGE